MNKEAQYIKERIVWNIRGVYSAIRSLYSKFVNKYRIEPNGVCPVQAEGTLPTGEYYYFRSRHTTWSVRIASSSDENAIWAPNAWVYSEQKYEGFSGGWIDKLEVVKNFNKAVTLYYKSK